VAARHQPPLDGAPTGQVVFEEEHPGELLAALERAERRALYCQSLVSTFVQSARDAYPGAAPQTVGASSLVASLLDEFPFEDHERHWVSSRVLRDFRLPGRRDLLYLVLCTLAKNAVQALRGRRDPLLRIEVDCETTAAGTPRGCIRFIDNGPGIAADVLARLTREPVTTRAACPRRWSRNRPCTSRSSAACSRPRRSRRPDAQATPARRMRASAGRTRPRLVLASRFP
jgi:two-component system response regulator PhcR